MSRNPVIVSGELGVYAGARLMKERGVSTLLIEDNGKIVGIVTDRDLITKVLAEGMDAQNLKIRDVMSSPVIWIEKDESIISVAKIMTKRRIRKLPVMSGNKVVGIISENDIARIFPDLIALVDEYSKMCRNTESKNPSEEYLIGKCEVCGQYSLRLRRYGGMLVCPECYDALR